jgi:hypothetical protein
MKLLTVGDSFTYGEELLDPQISAWPSLLGKHINYDVKNLALPAKSNNYMVRTVIENADEHDLIIVAWSHYARIEFSDDYGTYDIWPGNVGNVFSDDLSFRKELIGYINRYHNDKYLYTQYLLNIILLQGYLEQNNKHYIMLDSFGNTLSRHLNRELVKKINCTNYLGWPTTTMMEWTYGTPRGPRGHFLDQGHEIVADKIYEHIRHLGWLP